jgi:hypothetical protein
VTPSPQASPAAQPVATPKPVPFDPETNQSQPNPLRPLGNSLENLIQAQFDDDVWQALRGDLPCLEATMVCMKQLQELAVQKSPLIVEIDKRIEEANKRIEEAQARNKKAVWAETLSPALQAYLSYNPPPGSPAGSANASPLNKILAALINPTRGVNELLSLIGIPLFQRFLGGSPAAQQRAIAIGDLQIKVAELQRGRAELAQKLRDQVLLSVLEFDTVRRDFQVSQELARRETLRLRINEVTYRFGNGSTDQYLGQLSALDKQKAQAFTAWARMRASLAKIRILMGETVN